MKKKILRFIFIIVAIILLIFSKNKYSDYNLNKVIQACIVAQQQTSKKFIFEEVSFDSVTKRIVFKDFKDDPDINDMKKIINYWFDNKIKTNGFDGALEVKVNNIDIHKLKSSDYFKVSIKLAFEFIEIKASGRLNDYQPKKHTI